MNLTAKTVSSFTPHSILYRLTLVTLFYHIKFLLDNHSRLYADPPINERSMSKPLVAGLSFVNQIHDFNDFT